MRKKLTGPPWLGLPLSVLRRGREDRASTLAAALTYRAFLSLFPLLLLALSVLGFVLAGDPGARAEWARRLAERVPGLESLAERNLEALIGGRAGTGLIGLVGLAWAASGAADATRFALGRVFRVEPRGAVPGRLRALGAMFLLGAIVLASTALTTWGAGLFGGGAARALAFVGGAGADLILFLVSYRLLTPPGGPSAGDHLPGALLMTAGWTILKVGGGLLAVRIVARATALYGTVGAVFGLLAILNVAAQLFVYSAELSATLRERR